MKPSSLRGLSTTQRHLAHRTGLWHFCLVRTESGFGATLTHPCWSGAVVHFLHKNDKKQESEMDIFPLFLGLNIMKQYVWTFWKPKGPLLHNKWVGIYSSKSTFPLGSGISCLAKRVAFEGVVFDYTLRFHVKLRGATCITSVVLKGKHSRNMKFLGNQPQILLQKGGGWNPSVSSYSQHVSRFYATLASIVTHNCHASYINSITMHENVQPTRNTPCPKTHSYLTTPCWNNWFLHNCLPGFWEKKRNHLIPPGFTSGAEPLPLTCGKRYIEVQVTLVWYIGLNLPETNKRLKLKPKYQRN